ncbi:hypothetical protein [Streptomyces sp. NPDC005805]|uniref:hypothetical protein n=1 Tax=Streptomyces sp. NPDC005805 TaxID=3157068 RepID=UPI0033E04828
MKRDTGLRADFTDLRDQAVALRREGLSLRQIRDRLHIHNNDLLHRLVKGEPPPEWTKRPNAKDDLRARARTLRLAGMTYDQIQLELGCSKSSISLWVRDLPKPEPRHTEEEQRALMNAGLARVRAARDEERKAMKAEAERSVGALSDRELMLVGTALYWAEGGKDKPWDRREHLKFINSDPEVIKLYIRWLELLGVTRQQLRLTLNIHESADVAEAHAYWARLTGTDASHFNKPVIKRHNPLTRRKNTGAAYRGALTIYVKGSAALYRRMEGTWYGIVGAALAPETQNRT